MDIIADKESAIKYTIKKSLGEGSFGEAVLCQTTHPQCHSFLDHVVLKRVNLLKTFRCLDDFQALCNEVKVLEKLNHVNVIGYHRAFTDTTDWYNIALEYADSGDLGDYIAKHKARKQPLPEFQIHLLMRQLLEALLHIHSHHIIHRDLKPKNVFLHRKGIVKLGDFGISKLMDHTLQMTQSTLGTPLYMAPEVFESAPYDSKVDMWSFGCIMYEFCTFSPPFRAQFTGALIAKIAKGHVEPIPQHYSTQLMDVIRKLLTARDLRPSAKELINHPYFKPSPPKTLNFEPVKKPTSPVSPATAAAVASPAVRVNKEAARNNLRKASLSPSTKTADVRKARSPVSHITHSPIPSPIRQRSTSFNIPPKIESPFIQRAPVRDFTDTCEPDELLRELKSMRDAMVQLREGRKFFH